MKLNNIKKISLILLISIFLIIFNITIKKHMIIYAESIMGAFLLIIVFLSIILFGYQKDKKNRLKTDLFFQSSAIILIYFTIIYLSGLLFGYTSAIFSLKPMSIINNIFAPLVIFICMEIFRYIITCSNRNNKVMLVLFNIIIGLIELSISTRYLYFYNAEMIFKSIVKYIVPITLKQVTFGYLCYYGGMKPLFFYRIIMVLYMYIIPILPNLSETITSICNILLPGFILLRTNELVTEYEQPKKEIIKPSNPKIEIFIEALIVIIVILFVSDVLPVGLTAIASDSMRPTFSKGAGVITLKVDEDKDIKEGDIISFNQEGKNIVHRIKTIENVDGEIRYITKGDANTDLDKGYVTIEDINNKVIVSIPFIGYPSVFFSEIFKK